MQKSFLSFKKTKDLFVIFISSIFLYYTYKNFSINDLNIAIKKVELLSLIIYLTIFIPLIFLLSKKYIILINKYKKISLVQSTKINIISSFYNIFLPAKIGDIFRIFIVKSPRKTMQIVFC